MSFVHLHVHTNFSFGDGAGRIDELVDAARRLGMPALSVTDHDGLYGAVRFYQACKAAGVKPIVGVEISVESILAAPGALRGATGNDAAAGAKASNRARMDARASCMRHSETESTSKVSTTISGLASGARAAASDAVP